MSLSANPLPDLPPLAWLFERRPDGAAVLNHGAGVSVGDNGFFEGCADVTEGGLESAANVFGSGAVRANGSWVFVTPSHTLESLYVYVSGSGWSVSNSLAFLAARHQLVPPPAFRYGSRFATLSLGIDRYESELFRVGEGRVFRVAYDNLTIGPDGRIQRLRKPLPPPFGSFEEYVAYLTDTLRKALVSAASTGRGYAPLATCSSGYDSAAAAALAARLGCSEAVTLRHARGDLEDSGVRIGEVLGLRVFECERPTAVDGAFASVAEFFATGMGGEDYCYTGFLPTVRGRTLLTGFHGDKIWESSASPNPVLIRGDVSGSSLQEFRLANDFLHIPVPMIGARRHPDIARISRDATMAAYQLHNSYDRPIPRRILEEAGVPRALFGMSKKAASVHLFHTDLLGERARAECAAILPRKWRRPRAYWMAERAWQARRRVHVNVWRMPAVGRLWYSLHTDWRVFEHGHPRAAVQFVAGLLASSERYATALRASGARR